MKNPKIKKRLIITAAVILATIILLTVAGPYLVLAAARQPEVESE